MLSFTFKPARLSGSGRKHPSHAGILLASHRAGLWQSWLTRLIVPSRTTDEKDWRGQVRWLKRFSMTDKFPHEEFDDWAESYDGFGLNRPVPLFRLPAGAGET